MDEEARTVLDNFQLKVLYGFALILIGVNISFTSIAGEIDLIPGMRGDLIRQLDLVREANLATWYTSALLIVTSMYSYRLARYHWHVNRRIALKYGFLAAGFILLSIDDVIQTHEFIEMYSASLITDLRNFDGLAVYLGPAFAAVLVIALMILISGHPMREIKRKNRSFLVISFVCLLIAVVAEIIYINSECSNIDLCFRIEIAFEESSEIIAILAFFTFLRREMADQKTQTHERSPHETAAA